MRPPGSRVSGPLADFNFFKNVSEDTLAELMDYLEDRLYFPGQTIVSKGDRGDFMVVLHSGTAEVRDDNLGTEDRVLQQLGTHSVYGEKALLGVTSERNTSVVATSV